MSEHKNAVQNRGWVYAELGDYHRNLNLDWSYAPTYLLKMKLIRKFFSGVEKDKLILDAGCGEGVLVEELKSRGYKVFGIDKNYQSENVQLGDIRKLPYENNVFDVVLLLDVLEHFEYRDQEIVLKEIHRVLREGGIFIITVPNLAHLNSRFTTFFQGKLDRSDAIIDHPGERSMHENVGLIEENGFKVRKIKGLTLSVPIIIRFIRHFPRQLLWLHNALNVFAIPSLSQWNYIECIKGK